MCCVVMACFTVSRLQIFKKKVLSRFCRACACELNETYEIENNPGKPELPLLLKRYVPEFNIEVENACLCIDCVSVLYIFHNFKRKCLQTEGDLRLHIRKHPEVKAVNLNDIFAPKKQTNNGLSLGTNAITAEPIRQDTELFLETEVTIEDERIEPPPETAEHICEFCSTVFPQEHWLLCHKRNCRKPIRYQCFKCSRNFTCKNFYDAHVAYHQEPEAILHTCTICNFVYKSKEALKRHNIYKHSSDDQKEFQCEACGKRFGERSVLKKHMRNICKCSDDDLRDYSNQKPFKCEVCARRFVEKSTLADHMQTHTLQNLYICSVCKYATAVITELDRHIREVHNIEAKTKLVCNRSNCRHVFFAKKSLEMHEQSSHSNKRKRYQCDKCSRDFALEKPYYEHLEYHKKTNARRHTCEICNLVYHTHSSLRRHNIYKHMSDDKKPFQCEVCTVRFLDKSVLAIHMRSHTGERPFKCPLCTYAATTKSSLYKHVSKWHTNSKVQFHGKKCVLVQ